METTTPEPENFSIVSDRRTFLARARIFVKTMAFFSLLMPLARFLSFTPPHKPRFVEVNKVLKKGGFIIESDFILFDLEEKAIAVSRTCTHLGCKLNFHELENVLICPCHKSRFDKYGKRLDGPARQDLATYAVDQTGGADLAGYIVAIT